MIFLGSTLLFMLLEDVLIVLKAYRTLVIIGDRNLSNEKDYNLYRAIQIMLAYFIKQIFLRLRRIFFFNIKIG
jgi:hypothetical protein